MEKDNRARSEIAPDSRTRELAEELDRLKKELKRTRGAFKRLCIAEEIRVVAAQLAQYTTH